MIDKAIFNNQEPCRERYIAWLGKVFLNYGIEYGHTISSDVLANKLYPFLYSLPKDEKLRDAQLVKYQTLFEEGRNKKELTERFQELSPFDNTSSIKQTCKFN